jgi:Fe2+ or Zn2+ uptake regulation protein
VRLYPNPIVEIRHPFAIDYRGVRCDIDDAIELVCTECGDLSDWDNLEERHRLQDLAARHAREVHDDLVEARGWAR